MKHLRNSQLSHNLDKYLREQTHHYIRFSKEIIQCSSPSYVHKLRVTTRRIRAIVWILERASTKLSFKKLKRMVRTQGKALGSLREIDVAISDADEFNVFKKKLKKLRKSSKKTLHRSLTRKDRKAIITELNKSIDKVKKQKNIYIDSAMLQMEDRLLPWFHKKLRTTEDFHEFRIEMKKARYCLESLEKPFVPLKRLQDTLGKLHDLEVLVELTGKNLKVSEKQNTLKEKAKKMMKPALSFATRQLDPGNVKR